MDSELLLQVSALSKSFAVPVLEDVTFTLQPGEVVAITGENGAGKSTLSKILAGLLRPDAGSMRLDGKPYCPMTRGDAEHLGVRIVLQELSLIDTLSVAENLQLGSLPTRAGFIDFAEMHTRARTQLEQVGLQTVAPSLAVGELGIGQQQLLEICRGLSGQARLLILDEPTAVLTQVEVALLFEILRTLKGRGVGILYISHRLGELSQICDRIMVLRDGRVTSDSPTAALTHDDIVSAMVGCRKAITRSTSKRSIGAPLLRVRGLGRRRRVRDVSFDVHAREILGIAGLVGSGRTELLRLIFGADRADTGSIHIGDSAAPAHIDSPAGAVRLGIGLLPEDRKAQGLLLTQSLRTNITLANVPAISSNGWIDASKDTSLAMKLSKRLRIRADGIDQAVVELSGGNQQKSLLARWIHRDCRILLLDEPTRGVDIGARADIYRELDALAAAGCALVVVSSDLAELMLICNRIAVMSDGRLVQIFARGEWNEQVLLRAAFAAHSTQTGRMDPRTTS